MWKAVGSLVWAILLMLFCLWFAANFGLALIKAAVTLLIACVLFAVLLVVGILLKAISSAKE